jgi:hypothetical protein
MALVLGFEKKSLLWFCWSRTCVSWAMYSLWLCVRADGQLPWLDESALRDSIESDGVYVVSTEVREAWAYAAKYLLRLGVAGTPSVAIRYACVVHSLCQHQIKYYSQDRIET